MTGLLHECQQCFGTEDLYKALGIEKTSTPKEVQKAYRRTSLRVHPDRVDTNSKDDATRQFQTLGKIYTILSDAEKRAVYDESGDVDDDDVSLDRDWANYWRQLFVPITLQAIRDFEKAYKGSAEELDHLKTAYVAHDGDMDAILDDIFCATVDDEPRFRKLLAGLVAAGELDDFSVFSREPRRKKADRIKKAGAERAEAEEASRQLGLDPSSSTADEDLAVMIRKRNAARADDADGFIAHLEKKYAAKEKTKPKPKKKGRKAK